MFIEEKAKICHFARGNIMVLDGLTTRGGSHDTDLLEYSDLSTREVKTLKQKEAMMTSSNGNIFRVTGPLCG